MEKTSLKHWLMACLALLICAGVAPPQATPSARAQTELQPVVIAAQDLPRGLLLTEALVFDPDFPALTVILLPPEHVPASAYTSLEATLGQIVRTDIPRGVAIAGHFLLPDLRQTPTAAIPFPISPTGYRAVFPLGLHHEVILPIADYLRYPPGLAAGDRVSIAVTTGLGDMVRDETHLLATDALVVEVGEAQITLSTIQADLSREIGETAATGFPMALLLGSPNQPPQIAFPELAISWGYLTQRSTYPPLVIPPGADMSQFGGGLP